VRRVRRPAYNLGTENRPCASNLGIENNDWRAEKTRAEIAMETRRRAGRRTDGARACGAPGARANHT